MSQTLGGFIDACSVSCRMVWSLMMPVYCLLMKSAQKQKQIVVLLLSLGELVKLLGLSTCLVLPLCYSCNTFSTTAPLAIRPYLCGIFTGFVTVLFERCHGFGFLLCARLFFLVNWILVWFGFKLYSRRHDSISLLLSNPFSHIVYRWLVTVSAKSIRFLCLFCI